MSDDKLYLVTAQRECDDPYYRPYQDVIGVYRTRDNAVRRAKEAYENMKDCMHGDECYMVDQVAFGDDREGSGMKRRHVFVIDREGVETTTFT